MAWRDKDNDHTKSSLLRRREQYRIQNVVMMILFMFQKPYETRCIARSFAPDYNHHFEMDCPVLSHGDNDSPTCLAAHLAAGEILLEVWHK